jgi:hypothetical protein
MQHGYVGDFGDFVKLALLRELSENRKLFIAWYLHPDDIKRQKQCSDGRTGDGRHVSYLDHPEIWRPLADEVFDFLRDLRALCKDFTQETDVTQLQDNQLLPGCTYYSEMIPVQVHHRARPENRRRWLEELRRSIEESGADLVFVDPDNGIQPNGFRACGKKSGKCIKFDELKTLAAARPLIVYHHQTRMKGGHQVELTAKWKAIASQLPGARVDAIRASNFSPRIFYLINLPDDLGQKAKLITERWSDNRLRWHSHESLSIAADRPHCPA